MSPHDPAPSSTPAAEAPDAGGWPVVGHMPALLRDLAGGLARLERRFGSVFWGRFPGHRVLVLLGPDAAEHVLKDRAGNFASRPGWEPFIGRVFPGSLLAMDGAEHRHHRRIMQVAFSRPALAGYHATLHTTLDDRLAAWGDGRPTFALRVYPALKRLTLDIAARAFMGVDLGPRAEAMNRAFAPMVAAPISMIRWAIPGTAMWAGLRGRARLVTDLGALLEARRERPGDDLFSRLCHAVDEDGARLSDAQVIDGLAFLMMAAHDTTTTALTALTYLLAAHPAWQDRLRDEARAASTADADGEPALDWAFKEALRLYPPLASVPRRAAREHTFAGFRVPAGAMIGLYPIHTHRLPDLWPDPERFDPERFRDDRREGRHPGAWVPFGAGAHICIGQHFAALEVRAVMTHLLRRFRWRVPPGYVMPYQAVPIGQPRDGLPVAFERLT